MSTPASTGGDELPLRPLHRPPPRVREPAVASAASPQPLPSIRAIPPTAAVRRLPRRRWLLTGGICLTAAALGVLAATAWWRTAAPVDASSHVVRQQVADGAAQLRDDGPPPESAPPAVALNPIAPPPPSDAEVQADSPEENLPAKPVPVPRPAAKASAGEQLAEAPTAPTEIGDPLQALPPRVDLPLPHARGRLPAACDLGPLPLLAGQSISFGLLGGDQAWSGEGGFEIEPSETPRTARVLMATAGGNRRPARIVSVAQLDVAADRLRFLWLVDNSVADAVFLRNCILKVSVGDNSRHLALRTPLHVPSLVVDVRNDGVTFQGRVEHLPRHEAVWLEMSQPSDAFPVHTFDGTRRLGPDQKTTIRLLGQAQEELLWLQVAFGVRRHGQLTVAVRPLTPDGRRFDPRIAERQLAALQTELQLLHARYQSAAPEARPPLEAAYQRQTAALERQIAAFGELHEACQRLLAAPLSFRVFLLNPETETDLICGTPDPVNRG